MRVVNDRRASPRVTVRGDAFLQTSRGVIRCHCVDLSMGGMAVLSPRSIRPKQRARIQSGFGGITLTFDAVVVRRKRTREGHLLGLRFVQLDEPTQHKLEEVVHTMQRQTTMAQQAHVFIDRLPRMEAPEEDPSTQRSPQLPASQPAPAQPTGPSPSMPSGAYAAPPGAYGQHPPTGQYAPGGYAQPPTGQYAPGSYGQPPTGQHAPGHYGQPPAEAYPADPGGYYGQPTTGAHPSAPGHYADPSMGPYTHPNSGGHPQAGSGQYPDASQHGGYPNPPSGQYPQYGGYPGPNPPSGQHPQYEGYPGSGQHPVATPPGGYPGGQPPVPHGGHPPSAQYPVASPPTANDDGEWQDSTMIAPSLAYPPPPQGPAPISGPAVTFDDSWAEDEDIQTQSRPASMGWDEDELSTSAYDGDAGMDEVAMPPTGAAREPSKAQAAPPTPYLGEAAPFDPFEPVEPSPADEGLPSIEDPDGPPYQEPSSKPKLAPPAPYLGEAAPFDPLEPVEEPQASDEALPSIGDDEAADEFAPVSGLYQNASDTDEEAEGPQSTQSNELEERLARAISQEFGAIEQVDVPDPSLAVAFADLTDGKGWLPTPAEGDRTEVQPSHVSATRQISEEQRQVAALDKREREETRVDIEEPYDFGPPVEEVEHELADDDVLEFEDEVALDSEDAEDFIRLDADEPGVPQVEAEALGEDAVEVDAEAVEDIIRLDADEPAGDAGPQPGPVSMAAPGVDPSAPETDDDAMYDGFDGFDGFVEQDDADEPTVGRRLDIALAPEFIERGNTEAVMVEPEPEPGFGEVGAPQSPITGSTVAMNLDEAPAALQALRAPPAEDPAQTGATVVVNLNELMASAQGSPAAQSLAADWGAKPPPSEPTPAVMGSAFDLQEMLSRFDQMGTEVEVITPEQEATPPPAQPSARSPEPSPSPKPSSSPASSSPASSSLSPTGPQLSGKLQEAMSRLKRREVKPPAPKGEGSADGAEPDAKTSKRRRRRRRAQTEDPSTNDAPELVALYREALADIDGDGATS